MKTIGLVISRKENENRRALIPDDIEHIKNKEYIFIEEGYGSVLGYSDEEYLNRGIGGVCSRDEILKKDIVCDPKIGDAEYLEQLQDQTIWGWIHAVQNKEITDKLVKQKLTVYAWEDMFELGRHSFWRNNEIAGEAAIMHAYLRHGIFPYNTNVAVLGRGNISRGAIKILNYLGANVVVYDRKTEQLFRQELGKYDVVVNAILWDTNRKDHIIYREDLKRMKKGSMIIDISCDRAGGVETAIPTTIENPDYFVDNVRHYVVDHTPSLFYKTASMGISEVFVKYADLFIEDKMRDDAVLSKTEIISKGNIVDQRIIDFQNR
ncbi:MAG: N(5)-(carboxyethyl)ornithine synthase [Muribaculaceae bacterium]|nr:N(5)-(carboxyethyl)ornithine synthase [Muribaculaceae bacterium]MEE1298638.1 N(5)-(carboxyethyl)ornithine synthase [Muribaculaceae bacterium]